LILPDAVRLKRFFAPLLVFILGISVPWYATARHARWRRKARPTVWWSGGL
jgi:hypothetical protein